MSHFDTIPARGATGRADLLRLLAIVPRERITLDCDASGWLGYVRGREAPPQPVRIEPRPGTVLLKPAPDRERWPGKFEHLR